MSVVVFIIIIIIIIIYSFDDSYTVLSIFNSSRFSPGSTTINFALYTQQTWNLLIVLVSHFSQPGRSD